MMILFDQGTPFPLGGHLKPHRVETCRDRGWSQLQNGALLLAAEQAGFDVFITTDQSLKYQQNLTARRIAIVVLGSTSWPKIQPCIAMILQAISTIKAADYIEIPI